MLPIAAVSRGDKSAEELRSYTTSRDTIQISTQCECHCFYVDPIGLGAPSAARDQKTRSIEDKNIDTASTQEAGKPEAVISRLETDLQVNGLAMLVSQSAIDLLQMI